MFKSLLQLLNKGIYGFCLPLLKSDWQIMSAKVGSLFAFKMRKGVNKIREKKYNYNYIK